VQRATHGCVRGLERRGLALDRDRFRQVADLEREVEGHELLGPDADPLVLDRLEPLHGDLHRVRRRIHVDEGVLAHVVRLGVATHVGRLVDEIDPRSRYHGALLADEAAQATVIRLGQDWRRPRRDESEDARHDASRNAHAHLRKTFNRETVAVCRAKSLRDQLPFSSGGRTTIPSCPPTPSRPCPTAPSRRVDCAASSASRPWSPWSWETCWGPASSSRPVRWPRWPSPRGRSISYGG